MSRLVLKKYKISKDINDILVFKLVGVGGNNIKNFFIYNVNITIYIFNKITIITIINFK